MGSRCQSPFWNPRCALRAGRTLTAATWSNSVSPPRLLLAHCSSKPVSVPALAKPALYDGVANMSVAQHLRQRESPMFFVAVCRRWVAEEPRLSWRVRWCRWKHESGGPRQSLEHYQSWVRHSASVGDSALLLVGRKLLSKTLIGSSTSSRWHPHSCSA